MYIIFANLVSHVGYTVSETSLRCVIINIDNLDTYEYDIDSVLVRIKL
jgi:hypothetical protein